MDSSPKGKVRRDVVLKFDDQQIKEMAIQIDRSQGAPIVYANLSKFSRLGVDFVLDLIQIDPAEFNLAIEGARQSPEEAANLEMPGKVVARVLMGPILVKNVRDQADQILEGVEVKPPKVEDKAEKERATLLASAPKVVN
jgi:hypothetical protein